VISALQEQVTRDRGSFPSPDTLSQVVVLPILDLGALYALVREVERLFQPTSMAKPDDSLRILLE